MHRFVDYSAKYGLAFQMSDKSSGVHFNDGSKISSAKDSVTFDFIKRELQDSKKKDVITQYTFSCYPSELQKKVNLFTSFSKYLAKPDSQAKQSALVVSDDSL